MMISSATAAATAAVTAAAAGLDDRPAAAGGDLLAAAGGDLLAVARAYAAAPEELTWLRSPARLPIADRYDLPVIVVCAEGYSSSLAAAALQDLGLHRATDLIGGIAAWRAAGLPVTDRAGADPQTTLGGSR